MLLFLSPGGRLDDELRRSVLGRDDTSGLRAAEADKGVRRSSSGHCT